MRRVLAVVMVAFLVVSFPVAAIAQETPTPTTSPTGDEVAGVEEREREPTEYFAYGAAGLFFLTVLAVGFLYLRMVTKSANENQ